MSPLYLHNNKLLKRNNKLATSDDCCCCQYAIFLCNSNAQKDNPFYVTLNGQQIGEHVLRAEGTIDGEFWVTNPDITLDMLSCENCEVCAQDEPWVQPEIALPPDPITGVSELIPNPAYVPGKAGFDLSSSALCKDCIGKGEVPLNSTTSSAVAVPANPTEIRILPLDKNLINENGNNTITLVNPLTPPQTPALPGSYGRIWFIKFKFSDAENKFKVDSIILSTAYSSGDPYTVFNYDFDVFC